MILNDLILVLKNKKAIVFNPALGSDLRSIRFNLVAHKMPDIPADYINFLMVSDGLIFKDLNFFGSLKRERLNYNFPSLFEVNQNFIQDRARTSFLILGNMAEFLIGYDRTDKNYVLVDRFDLTDYVRLPRFIDVLYLCVKNDL